MKKNDLHRHLWYTLDANGALKISIGNILMETVEDCKSRSADEINEIVEDVIKRKAESFRLTTKLFC